MVVEINRPQVDSFHRIVVNPTAMVPKVANYYSEMLKLLNRLEHKAGEDLNLNPSSDSRNDEMSNSSLISAPG
jgi:hypothetical protein